MDKRFNIGRYTTRFAVHATPLLFAVVGGCGVSGPDMEEKQILPETPTEAFPAGEYRSELVRLPGLEPQLVTYQIVGGHAVLEGDMIIDDLVKVRPPEAGSLVVVQSPLVASTNRSHLWPNSVMPFTLDAGLSDGQRSAIAAGQRLWTANTRMRFEERTNESNYVHFVPQAGPSGGCSSAIGRSGGRQEIRVGPCGSDGIAHEIAHAAGVYHEQSRLDRNEFICLDRNQASGVNFVKASASSAKDYGSMDFNSVMMYGSCGSSPTAQMWKKQGTCSATGPSCSVTSDQLWRGGSTFSPTDIWAINQLYGAPDLGLPLFQVTSGMCIHPQGGNPIPDNGTPVILNSICSKEQRLKFQLHSNGSIRHVTSGKCLHPEGGANFPTDGTRLVFDDKCSGLIRIAFEVTDGGSLRHRISGKCVHPRGGSATPSENTELVLDSGCDEPRLEFNGKLAKGRLAHSSGLCVHPWGGVASNGTALVLYEGCSDTPNKIFELRSDGSIQHVASGRCINPKGGSPTPPNGTELILDDACGESRLAFRALPSGSIQHITSGKCIHPSGGLATPDNNTSLVLWDGCNDATRKFAPVTFFTP